MSELTDRQKSDLGNALQIEIGKSLRSAAFDAYALSVILIFLGVPQLFQGGFGTAIGVISVIASFIKVLNGNRSLAMSKIAGGKVA